MIKRNPGAWSFAYKLLSVVSVLAICGVILALIYTWHSFKPPGQSVKDIGRAVFRMEQPRDPGIPPNEADARDIAAAVAIDSEGERVDLLGEARLELIDIHFRAKKRLPHLSYRQIVAKAIVWVPDDWKYPKRWQDRDSNITSMGRSESVKELVPIVLKRMAQGPADGCSAKIIRAKVHWAGWLGGESGAAKIIATYPKDPRFDGRGFKTDFRCMP